MSLEVLHAPVISTAHVSEQNGKRISAAIDSGEINGMQRDEGWFIHIGTGRANDVIAKEMPTLHGVLEYFSDKPFQWVMFDCDGDTVDELKTFDW